MVETFKEFIERRTVELEKLRQPLLVQLREIRAALNNIDKEKEELEIAINAIAPKERNTQTVLDIVSDAAKLMVNFSHDKTIKDAVLTTLSKYRSGLAAIDILAEVNRILGTAYMRTSLSPQLSRLKSDGFIVLESGLWKLAPEKDKAADANLEEETPAAFSETPAQGREAGPGGGT